MQSTATRARPGLFSLIAVIFLIPTLCGANTSAHPGTPIEQGFDNMYNLDFSAAHRQFDLWEAAHPDDPMGPVSQATALLFTEFARLGVLESQLFTDNDRFDDRRKLTPDPQTKQQFVATLDRADALADKALQRNSQDVNSEFAKVLSFGLRSDYAVLIYLTGIKPAPIRWILSARGVETDKAKGVHDLELTADHGDLLAPFARLLLAVAALRDKDQPKACSLLTDLSQRYTRNPLYRRELTQNHC